MWWYSENGFMDGDIVTDYWCGGYINIRGTTIVSEYNLPIMHESSWFKFSNWLERFKSKNVVSYDELIETFQREKKHKIIWFDNEKQKTTA